MSSPATVHTRGAGADVLGVNWHDRIISVVVIPFEQSTLVEYRGQIWEEVIARGAFDSLADKPPERIRVNREHSRADTVGKVVRFDTRDPRGLIADIRIAATARGDDTLGLADEGMLSASAGFGVDPASGQVLDRTRRVRRVTQAFLDHVALVMQPAYAGAEVLAVRSTTPNLDKFTHDPVMAWATLRTDRVFQWATRRTRSRGHR